MKKQDFFTRPGIVCITAVFCCALWGSAVPFIKTGYLLFSIDATDTASILVFAGLRFALAGILVLIAGSFLQKRILLPTKTSLKAIPILALFQTAGQYFLYYIGLAHTSGVNGSIISGTSAFFALLVASLLFRFEKLSLTKVIGCILGFFGILIMNLQGVQPFSLLGDGFMILSQLSSAISAAFIKLFTQKDGAVMLSGYQFFLGGVVLMAVGLLMGGHLELNDVSGLLVLFHLAFVSACAYTLWGILLSKNPVSKVGIFGCLIPIMGVLLSALMLQETGQAFSWTGLLSLTLIVCGVWIVNKGDKRQDD